MGVVMAKFETLKGKTLTKIERVSGDVLLFTTDKGEMFKLYHDQSCCEFVTLEEVHGDFDDLLGTPVLLAEEVVSDKNRPPKEILEKMDPIPPSVLKAVLGVAEEDDNDEYSSESNTWTFYKLSTIKGSVTLRWHGSSNGYYSERVDFERIGLGYR
jgi:hypothetical protein